MMLTNRDICFPKRLRLALPLALIAVFLLCALSALAQTPPGSGTNSLPTYKPLASWSFHDHTNWTSDSGHAPVTFTNLDFSHLGNGSSLVVNNTNGAWLQYNIMETNGTTNLTVAAGTVMFWFAPSWSGTNAGGTGPGQYGRLLEIGSYTPDSSYGLWSLCVDEAGANLYFATQTNDLSSNLTVCVSAPISWTTNYFHAVALTYSATNTALYLDGALVTNGPPLTVYPGPEVLGNGFFIGSASNGVAQAQGLFNSLQTYTVPLDAANLQQMFNRDLTYYLMSPLNRAMSPVASAGYSPSITATPNVITGQGNLQWISNSTSCVYGSNAWQIWLTNITATAASPNPMTVTFAIAGGDDLYFYDVFATSSLQSLTNTIWAWQGQAGHCQFFSLGHMPSTAVFLILGTPQDTDGDGLTDAYELLVSHTAPDNPDTDGDGLPDGWSVLLGLEPLGNISTQPSARANYTYTLADWLNQISGIKSGTVTLDNEGNVLSTSQ